MAALAAQIVGNTYSRRLLLLGAPRPVQGAECMCAALLVRDYDHCPLYHIYLRVGPRRHSRFTTRNGSGGVVDFVGFTGISSVVSAPGGLGQLPWLRRGRGAR